MAVYKASSLVALVAVTFAMLSLFGAAQAQTESPAPSPTSLAVSTSPSLAFAFLGAVVALAFGSGRWLV